MTGRIVAGIALIIAAPVLLVIAAAIWLDDRGTILYRQTRIGRFGSRFTIYKFRSMRSRPGLPLTCQGDPRITRIGRILRASKLDELPQLWNIVRGEMAWIGPRPEVPEFVNMSDPLWRQVLQLQPGLADRASFAFRHEGQLLAQAADPQDFYRREILPKKLRQSLKHAEQRSPAR